MIKLNQPQVFALAYIHKFTVNEKLLTVHAFQDDHKPNGSMLWSVLRRHGLIEVDDESGNVTLTHEGKKELADSKKKEKKDE